jgi:hypothetical protein
MLATSDHEARGVAKAVPTFAAFITLKHRDQVEKLAAPQRVVHQIRFLTISQHHRTTEPRHCSTGSQGRQPFGNPTRRATSPKTGGAPSTCFRTLLHLPSAPTKASHDKHSPLSSETFIALGNCTNKAICAPDRNSIPASD